MASSKNTEDSMYNIARGFASVATRKARQLAPNKHLRRSIKSTADAQGKGKFIIKVQASGPDARAREYGSGIHARRIRTSPHQLGPRGKILIRPVNKKALAFYWEKGPGAVAYDIKTHAPVAGTLSGGVFVGKKVEHPGVEAANGGKGYVAPALVETRKLIRKRMGEISQAMKIDVRSSITKGRANAK